MLSVKLMTMVCVTRTSIAHNRNENTDVRGKSYSCKWTARDSVEQLSACWGYILLFLLLASICVAHRNILMPGPNSMNSDATGLEYSLDFGIRKKETTKKLSR
jgi:hypothetical protein